MSSFQKTVAPGGMRVVTEMIPHVKSISIGVWIDAGSRDEQQADNGLSHFLEHMVFKGTEHYSASRIARSLESVGGYLNAFTSKEHTCFYARILDEHLERAVSVLADLVQYPVFEPKEVEKEKQVILEEIKNIEDTPDDVIFDYFERNIFREHTLANPVIGSAANVGRFTASRLDAHRRRRYVPSRMVVAAAGNVRHDEVVALVERLFPGRSSRNGHADRRPSRRSAPGSTEVVEKPINQAHVCLGTVAYGMNHRKRYPLLVLNTLLGEGMSSRLFQNIREKYGFAYSIYSFANFLSDTGDFGVYVGTDASNVQNCIDLIHQEMHKLRAKPVGGAELRRTKAQLKGSMMLGLENTSSRMMRLGSGELYFGEFIPLDEVRKNIDGVTEEEISGVAAALLDPKAFSTVVIRPAERPEGQA